MKAIDTDQKIILDHPTSIAIVYLNQSFLQERKLHATSMMKAQSHQEQTHAATQLYTREQQGNSSQLINTGLIRTNAHRTDGASPLSTPSAFTRRRR